MRRVLWIVGMLLLAGSARAQGTPTPPASIQAGELREGVIEHPAQMDHWTFEGRSGSLVMVDMSGREGLDAYLELLGPDQSVLAADDDSGPDEDARLFVRWLPEDGTYTIRAASSSGTTTGPYRLSLRQENMQSLDLTATALFESFPTPTPVPDGYTLRLNEEVFGEMPFNRHVATYHLTIQEPVTVEIRMQAADGETGLYLELARPSGPARTLVDYSEADPTVHLPAVELDAEGTYTFRILNNQNRQVRYMLRVDQTLATVDGGGTIRYNQGVSGLLTFANQEDEWTFAGRMGDVVTIIMNGVDMDSYLVLLDPEHTELARDDDGHGGYDARIDRLTLPVDGTYTILASKYS